MKERKKSFSFFFELLPKKIKGFKKKKKKDQKKKSMSFKLCDKANGTYNLDLCDSRASTQHLGLSPFPATPLDGPAYILDKINLYQALTNQSAASLGPDQNCSTFKSLVDLVGFTGNFQQVTRFTLLAPSNAAFARLTPASVQALNEAKIDAVAGKSTALKDFILAHVIAGGDRTLLKQTGTEKFLSEAQNVVSVLSTTLFSLIPVASRPPGATAVTDLFFTLVPLQQKCPMSSFHKNPLRDLNIADATKPSNNQEINFTNNNNGGVACTNGVFHVIDGLLVVPNSVSHLDNILNINVNFANPPALADVGI
jgi:uncharacterized surface protein with fasciclin (FAS1) repeats